MVESDFNVSVSSAFIGIAQKFEVTVNAILVKEKHTQKGMLRTPPSDCDVYRVRMRERMDSSKSKNENQ